MKHNVLTEEISWFFKTEYFVLKNVVFFSRSLRKHAYLNILQILSPKNENFQIKNSDIFHVSATRRL